MDELFYCGFNGFRQVPYQPDKQTITSLISQSGKTYATPSADKNKHHIIDVAICWNYLVIADSEGLVKYGLANGKHGQCRLPLPPGGTKVRQISATPRHLLVVTEKGECWAHEESKGWRFVNVNAEVPDSNLKDGKPENDKKDEIVIQNQELDNINSNINENKSNEISVEVTNLIDLNDKSSNSLVENDLKNEIEYKGDIHSINEKSDSLKNQQNMTNSKVLNNTVQMLKTSCGDAHNIGLDENGKAYSLPSPLDFNPFPNGSTHKVTDVVCGKEHSLLLTEHGQVFSWGGGSRGQLGHGNLVSEEKPKLIMALDGMRIRKIAAGGWHSACISQYDDLYMFGWNESGQLAQPTNLTKPAECFSAVEKLFMACCTMQPEDDAALPRGFDSEDCDVYQKNNDSNSESVGNVEGSIGTSSSVSNLFGGSSCMGNTGTGSVTNPLGNFFSSGATVNGPLGCTEAMDSLEKDTLTCYNSTSCNADSTDLVVVQCLPMLVSLPSPNNHGSSGFSNLGKNMKGSESDSTRALDVACGSRHTVVLTKSNQLWTFGWNKYGQLGLGHNHSRDAPEKINIPKSITGKSLKMLRCGDWGTAIVVSSNKNPK